MHRTCDCAHIEQTGYIRPNRTCDCAHIEQTGYIRPNRTCGCAFKEQNEYIRPNRTCGCAFKKTALIYQNEFALLHIHAMASPYTPSRYTCYCVPLHAFSIYMSLRPYTRLLDMHVIASLYTSSRYTRDCIPIHAISICMSLHPYTRLLGIHVTASPRLLDMHVMVSPTAETGIACHHCTSCMGTHTSPGATDGMSPYQGVACHPIKGYQVTLSRDGMSPYQGIADSLYQGIPGHLIKG